MFRKKEDEEPTEAPAEESTEDISPEIEKKEIVEKRALQTLKIEGYWDTRVARLETEISERLWMARAVAGDSEDPTDMSWIELVDKAESTYIELRCSLTKTPDAPTVIMEAHNQLRALKQMTGTKLYPTALLGMIQSCLHEQDMGFKSTAKSIWDFSIGMVNKDYIQALKGGKPEEKKEDG